MHILKIKNNLQLIALGLFAIFGMTFSHFALPDSMGMMADEHGNIAQCQNICNLSMSQLGQNKSVQFIKEQKEPLPAYATMLSLGALLSFLFFTINKLYLLSSWRPPDLVILHGLYRSGL